MWNNSCGRHCRLKHVPGNIDLFVSWLIFQAVKGLFPWQNEAVQSVTRSLDDCRRVGANSDSWTKLDNESRNWRSKGDLENYFLNVVNFFLSLLGVNWRTSRVFLGTVFELQLLWSSVLEFAIRVPELVHSSTTRAAGGFIEFST